MAIPSEWEPGSGSLSQDELRARARALLDLNRAADAARLLGPAVAAYGDAELYRLLVMAVWQADGPHAAATVADHALAEVGSQPRLAHAASFLFLELRQPAKALALARAAAEGAPQWVPGLCALAQISAQTGGHAAAAAAMRDALALAPDNAAVHVFAGDVAAAAWRPRLAGEHYRAAVRLDPSESDAYYGLGLLAERSARYGKAARWFMRALAINPGDTVVQARLRGLFGRVLMVISGVALILNIVVFVAFMTATYPQGRSPGLAAIWMVSLGLFGLFGGLVWYGIRAAPRALFEALRSDARVYRQARRAVRRTVAQLAILGAAVPMAIVPADTDIRAVFIALLLFPVGSLLGLVNLIALRLAFGWRGRRPVSR